MRYVLSTAILTVIISRVNSCDLTSDKIDSYLEKNDCLSSYSKSRISLTINASSQPGFYNCISKPGEGHPESVLIITLSRLLLKGSGDDETHLNNVILENNDFDYCKTEIFYDSKSIIVEQYKNHQLNVANHIFFAHKTIEGLNIHENAAHDTLIFALSLRCALDDISKGKKEINKNKVVVILSNKIEGRIVPHIIMSPEVDDDYYKGTTFVKIKFIREKEIYIDDLTIFNITLTDLWETFANIKMHYALYDEIEKKKLPEILKITPNVNFRSDSDIVTFLTLFGFPTALSKDKSSKIRNDRKNLCQIDTTLRETLTKNKESLAILNIDAPARSQDDQRFQHISQTIVKHRVVVI